VICKAFEYSGNQAEVVLVNLM